MVFWLLGGIHSVPECADSSKGVPFSYLDYSFYFFIRYVNAFKFMSLERIKTFEELSPNATSMFEVSHDNNDTVLPVRNLFLTPTPRQCLASEGQ